ncbi:MAG TPA: tetratricopeptide repeat protein [Phycisphaerae bacterium]|nr:tetratricopeptide repeat protein [Phycisphaerae bacterium]
MNDSNDIRKALAVFAEVCDLLPEQRPAALDAHCQGDVRLRKRVEQMLATEDDEHALLAESKHGVGAKIIAEHLSSNAFDVPTPERIDRYRILREIGRGGMGVVFEAEQDSPKRRVALKLIHANTMTPSLIKRFEREAFALGQLQHPGIAYIYESGTADVDGRRQPFLAMELIDGERITTFAKNHTLEIRARLELIARVCDAVQHAHQKGVIHRDLKPANILITEQDTRGDAAGGTSTGSIAVDVYGYPKILDFGVARLIESDAHAVTLQTDPGQIVGTLAYMSPEQVAGDVARIDTRCDVYALGVILFQLLTDRFPLDLTGKSVAEAARIIRDEEPVFLGSIDRSLRGDIETIVAKALEKDPERRYASAAELAADLRRFLHDEPITARPASAIYNLRKFARRNGGLVAGFALALLVLVAGLISTSYFLVEAQSQRDEAITARDEADHQRAIVETQRDELQAVQAWYGELISEIDVQELGDGLMAKLRDRVRLGFKDAERPEEEIANALTELEVLTTRANSTDLAIDALDLALFDRAEESIAERFADQPEIRAGLLTTVGKAYNELTRSERALAVLQQAEAALAEANTSDPLIIADIMIERAEAYEDLGRDADAVPILQEYLEHCRKYFGADEQRTLRAAAYLASCLDETGEHDEAGRLLEEALTLHAARYGEEDSTSLNLKLVLLWVELERGNDDDVGTLGEEIIAARRRLDGPDHPRTLTALEEVGQVYSNIGRTDEAVGMLREALDKSEQVLGSDHVATIRRRHRLATKLSSLGKFDEAAELLEQVKEIQVAAHGPRSWKAMQVQRSLAHIHFRKREFDKALPLLRECLPVAQKALGKDDGTALTILSEIGLCLNRLSRFKDAEETIREAYELNVAKHGADNRDSMKFATSIAGTLFAQGRYDEGIVLLSDELARARRVLGDQSRRTIIIVRDLMYALHDTGRYAEAEPLCREFLAYAHKVNDEAVVCETLIEQGSILIGLNEFEHALESLEEAVRMAGDATGSTAGRMHVLHGAALAGVGRFDEAEPIMLEGFEELESNKQRILIQRRKCILRDCAKQVAAMYHRWGKPDKATAWTNRSDAG